MTKRYVWENKNQEIIKINNDKNIVIKRLISIKIKNHSSNIK
jgi:hypothetical protein